MAIAGTVWFALALTFVASSDDADQAIGVSLLGILLAMIWTARDRMRHARHNLFEVVHPYGGWTALAALTAVVLRQATTSNPPDAGIVELLIQPTVLLLLALVALIIHPWLGVRSVLTQSATVLRRLPSSARNAPTTPPTGSVSDRHAARGHCCSGPVLSPSEPLHPFSRSDLGPRARGVRSAPGRR